MFIDSKPVKPNRPSDKFIYYSTQSSELSYPLQRIFRKSMHESDHTKLFKRSIVF